MNNNMEGKVAGPAIGLIVVGVLGVLLTIPSFFTGMIDPSVYEKLYANMPPEFRDQFDITEIMASSTSGLSIAWNVLMLVANVFIAWAGARMLSLKSWTAAIVASSLMMVTCLCQCCCCPIGVGIGIWALIVLLDADVKQAFEAKAAV